LIFIQFLLFLWLMMFAYFPNGFFCFGLILFG